MSIKSLFKMIGTIAIIIANVKGHAQTVSYSLKGTVGHLSEPAKAYLLYNNASGSQKDSTTINNGIFTFSGTVDQPRGAMLYISKKGTLEAYEGYIILYLESGNINVTSPDSVQDFRVSGGPVNADYSKLNLGLKDNNENFGKLKVAFAAVSPGQNNSKKITDSLEKQRDTLIAQRKSIYLAFIKNNPASVISLFALRSYGQPSQDVTEIEPIFNLLSTDLRKSKAGQSYAAEITRMKSIEIGGVAPYFSVADTSGKAISPSDFKGKYVLLDFWASWCAPCRADNVNVLRAYNTYKGKNFTVISISLDEVKNSWLTAIKEDQLPWTQVSDLKGYKSGGIAQLFNLHSIPQNILIDPDGKIVDKNMMGYTLTDRLKTILDK